MNKSIAIIPARGGSKRIPRKNIKDFLGKPVLSYSIQAALNSQMFDEVMVSTDDEEIANTAIKYGARVPSLRSSKNSDDHATTMNVIEEVLDVYHHDNNVSFQFACCIYPAAPLIKVQDLKAGFEKLYTHNYTCVFPAVAFDSSVWRALEINDTGNIQMLWSEHINTRTQDLKKIYHDAGQWYWFNADHIKGWEWPNNSGAIILSQEEVQDIDTPSDWLLAEMKYRLLFEEMRNV